MAADTTDPCGSWPFGEAIFHPGRIAFRTSIQGDAGAAWQALRTSRGALAIFGQEEVAVNTGDRQVLKQVSRRNKGFFPLGTHFQQQPDRRREVCLYPAQLIKDAFIALHMRSEFIAGTTCRNLTGI